MRHRHAGNGVARRTLHRATSDANATPILPHQCFLGKFMDKSTKIPLGGQPSAKTIKIPLFLILKKKKKWSSYFVSLKAKEEKKCHFFPLKKRPQ